MLLLEAAGPESTALAAAAVASGHQVHAATDPTTHATYPPDLKALLTGSLLTDFTRPGQALNDIIGYARRIGANALLTANEYLTELLAHACAALGLPGNDPDRAHAARNKAAMSEAFAAHGIAAPRTRIAGDEDALRRLLAAGKIGFPCVVKPADAAGSAGVTIARTPAEAVTAWRAARAVRGMYGLPLDSRVLVQEYADGTEYSVESVTQDGQAAHLCTTAKTVTAGMHRVETGHSLPAALPLHLEHAVHRQVERAIAAAGIQNGASHTEVIVSPDGRCTVIEIAARLGAGHIGFLLQHALGIDPWTALWDTALGRPADLTPTRRAHAAVRFLTAPGTGRLAAVHGLPQPGPGIPAVHLRRAVGERVEAPRANRGRLGHFIVTSPDAAAAERRADHLLAQVTIQVTPEEAVQPKRVGAGT
ncbi:carboxylase [Streptomyces sp. DJ]|nr:carboxylase [Streptomyces sp. DJ]